ncbi:MAG: hypothetical protein NTY01_22315 [Verrucomicrobia bacterium]|nr:hypothetical protein [Verrucomicrobiota bacterium]
MSPRFRMLVIVMSAAALLGVALAVHWMATPRGQAPTQPAALDGLKVNLMRCEVGAQETTAVVKVHLRARNDGSAPVRLGPGSFWLLDADEVPHLDRYAAEKPDAPPLKLELGQTGPEMELKFQLPPNLLARSLVLLIGEAPTGKVAGSPPPKKGIYVPVKEDGAPKGPFNEGDWKTFVGTRWR